MLAVRRAGGANPLCLTPLPPPSSSSCPRLQVLRLSHNALCGQTSYGYGPRNEDGLKSRAVGVLLIDAGASTAPPCPASPPRRSLVGVAFGVAYGVTMSDPRRPMSEGGGRTPTVMIGAELRMVTAGDDGDRGEPCFRAELGERLGDWGIGPGGGGSSWSWSWSWRR